ncbi:ring-cleaving dioxygenase [Bacillus sp. AFS041924]|uniref:ring-cleaving dioxygenase n=1 Tax=Bacillus sp. AFS041924 TaxID=2033503 RepID=UPI000BFB7518|nr:ring-cleaving dioxygenase [Bacillus sp. AFS041924]PGS47980.1 ring-cleaving dioxygenase [Bacillus sp. AFS041924]
MELLGIHHVSLLTTMPEKNYEFYTKVLGMRLVKKTVNQDNTSSYHLFYGDAKANPGTEITFFDIPNLGHTYPGHSMISSTSLRVASTDSLQYWKDRFIKLNISHDEIIKRANRDTLAFQDFEGTRLILVADNSENGVAPGTPWNQSDIPTEHGILGLGPVTLTVKDSLLTSKTLTEVLGFRLKGTYPSTEGDFANIEVYETGLGGSGAEVHIEVRPDLPRARPGRGSVHHVAFRVPTIDEYNQWADKINSLGITNSGKVERYYFKALYFREPNHILFELSTDTPGFDVDEHVDTLGERLALPPFLEPKRAEIEASLRPLDLDNNL